MSPSGSIGIEVNFLTGRYVATCFNDRRESEWPPHPARLFSALVAAWAEDGGDAGERLALEWLEAQAPPAITASEAVARSALSHFVPVNDAAVLPRNWHERKAGRVSNAVDQFREELVAAGGEITKKVERLEAAIARERRVEPQISTLGKTPATAALQMLPDGRGKQERFFPSVRPDDARVTYVWSLGPPDALRAALDGLLERVTRLGHSSSLVSCRVTLKPPEPSRRPGMGTGESIRCIRQGQLAELARLHARHNGMRPRTMPYTDVHYTSLSTTSPQEETLTPNTLGTWIVFEFEHDSRAFPAARGVELARTMRAAILHHTEDPIPEGLSGHRPDGLPTSAPHVAFVPVPYIGFEHADGRLLGIAVVVPDAVSPEAAQALYRAIGFWEREVGDGPLQLTMGKQGVAHMRRQRGPASLVSLRPASWTKSSRVWASATPVALPRHPGRLGRGTPAARAKAWELAEAGVVAACSHVDLPEPAAVEISLGPFVTGARPVAQFPAFSQTGRGGKPVRRQLVHAALTFDVPVSGPLLLGAGRFLGLGLMRPMSMPESIATQEAPADG